MNINPKTRMGFHQTFRKKEDAAATGIDKSRAAMKESCFGVRLYF